MSIPVTFVERGEQPGTFRKMVLVEQEHPAPLAQTRWKATKRRIESTTEGAPGTPKRPCRIATPPPGEELSLPTTTIIPLAASTTRLCPTQELVAIATTPPAAHPPSGERCDDDGDEWTKMANNDEKADDAGNLAMALPTSHEEKARQAPVQWAASRAERCVAPDIPQKHRARYNLLTKYLGSFEADKRAPPISPSEFGELMTDTPVRGTSYVDVLRALFVNSRFTTAGLCEAVAALRKAGAAVDLLGSQRAIDLYSLGGHTVAQRGGSCRIRENAHQPPGRAPRVLRVYK